MYTIEDISFVVSRKGGHERTLQIENDNIIRKTKLILTRFGGTFGTLNFIENSFFITLLGFTPYWDYEPTKCFHADRPGEYISENFFY